MELILYYFEYYGFLFVLLASVFAMMAGAGVNSTFRRYSAQKIGFQWSASQAAERVLRDNGIFDVKIARTSGNLTDHYNPKDRTIYLSDAVYDSNSTAAIGVATHEAGHAVQHAVGYFPLRFRSLLVPITNLGSRLSYPLILLGLFFSAFSSSPYGYEIALVGVALFSLSVVFQLVTLPTEFNASRRAISALESTGYLTSEELIGAKKTLKAAAMTYVAALAVSLTQFLRLLAIVLGNGRRRR